MKHELPQLPYTYDALEPFIDARTMELHHGKHHAGYVANLNKALENAPEFADWPLQKLLQSLDKLPENIRTAARNNGGGHYNHSLFWEIMGPPPPAGGSGQVGELAGKLGEAIKKQFGNFLKFREEFSKAAVSQFGSGWAWLTLENGGLAAGGLENMKLKISTTPNQDSPVMRGITPLMGLDVWEHAYYLKYQNRRAEYVESWWNVVNWKEVERRLDQSGAI